MLAKKQPVWSGSMRNITAGYRKSTPLAVGPVKGVSRGFGMTKLTVHSEKKHTEYTVHHSIYKLYTVCFPVSISYSRCTVCATFIAVRWMILSTSVIQVKICFIFLLFQSLISNICFPPFPQSSFQHFSMCDSISFQIWQKHMPLGIHKSDM